MERRGRPVVGVIGGLLFGLGLAVFIQQAGLWPLDLISGIALPVIGIALGLVLARRAPFGGAK